MSKTLDRLSKLIAQADNAGTPEEAAAFMERAEQLSSEIGVELAIARAHHASKERELPVENYRVQVNAWSAKPIHRAAMVDLFLGIARAHDVNCLIGHDNYSMFCFGLPSDIEIVEKLFGLASLQMVREADTALKRGEHKKGWPVHGKVYRRNFYEGFIASISSRLAQNRREAIQRADTAGDGSNETGIVLRDKRKEMRDFFQEKISHMKLAKSYVSPLDKANEDPKKDQSYTAVVHGNQAGQRANLGLSDRDLDGGKKELT